MGAPLPSADRYATTPCFGVPMGMMTESPSARRMCRTPCRLISMSFPSADLSWSFTVPDAVDVTRPLFPLLGDGGCLGEYSGYKRSDVVGDAPCAPGVEDPPFEAVDFRHAAPL